MKYALCLHGKAFGTTDIGNAVEWEGPFGWMKRTVLRPDVDVFCHTWGKVSEGEWEQDRKDQEVWESTLHWDRIKHSYHSIGSKCEVQKEFPGTPETRSIYSRWYSALESFKLALASGNKYDGILSARYDVIFKVPFPWDHLDPSRLWTPKWREKPAPDSGYLDYWFYGSVENMSKLMSLYYNLDGMFKELGVKENGHSAVGAQIDNMAAHGTPIGQWGEQPEDFQLYRRFMGARN